MKNKLKITGVAAALASTPTTLTAGEVSTNSIAHPPGSTSNQPQPEIEKGVESGQQNWNFHGQNTEVVQGYPAFSAKYTNPGYNSLPPGGETRETVSLDLMVGVRLWEGAEAHADGFMWQGFGLGNTYGVEAFPNGEANKVGTTLPGGSIVRLFIRQTFNFGGETETVDDDALHLAGKQDASNLTLTFGRLAVTDIFDNNSYASNPRTQFLNWAFAANEAWDYATPALNYTTGLAAELNQPRWTLRYGFFQMPGIQNSLMFEDRFLTWPGFGIPTTDGKLGESWDMPLEFEYRYGAAHPGKVRLLAYLNEADRATYAAAIAALQVGNNPASVRSSHFKYGFGLNWEQKITQNFGVFSRLGWNDGHTESWDYADVDRTASLGLSIRGKSWRRPDDTFGLAGVINGISKMHQEFFTDGGVGVLGGDGALNYGWEKTFETYYDFGIWKTIHATVDYQFVMNPTYNRDRGPVSFFGGRLHWEF